MSLDTGEEQPLSTFDGDGFDDLFVADTDDRHRTSDFGVSQMYLNKQDGTFEPVDIGINSDDLIGTWAGSFADYDRDGDPDLLIASGGYTMASTLAFYENRMSTDHRFVDVTSASGVTGSTAKLDDSFWWGVAWADYDNDGWLDVIITEEIVALFFFTTKVTRRSPKPEWLWGSTSRICSIPRTLSGLILMKMGIKTFISPE